MSEVKSSLVWKIGKESTLNKLIVNIKETVTDKKIIITFLVGMIVMSGFWIAGINNSVFNIYTLLELQIKSKILPNDCYGLDGNEVSERNLCEFFKFQTTVYEEPRFLWDEDKKFYVWEVDGIDNCIRKDYLGSYSGGSNIPYEVRGSKCESLGFSFDKRQWVMTEDDNIIKFERVSEIQSIDEYQTNDYNPTFEGIVTSDGWDCPETNQFGTIQDCITYWNSLSDLAENEGRYAMLKKLNNDGYLSDTVKQFIFEIEGIWLFDKEI